VSLPGLVGMPERDVCQYVSDKLGGQTLRIKMTFPYGRMPMVCSLKTSLRCGGRARGLCPGWAFGGTEGRSLPRSGGRSNQRAAVAFPDFPRLTNAGEGRAADADRRGNTRKEFSWIAAVIHDLWKHAVFRGKRYRVQSQYRAPVLPQFKRFFCKSEHGSYPIRAQLGRNGAGD
jgi:hypothetical protein